MNLNRVAAVALLLVVAAMPGLAQPAALPGITPQGPWVSQPKCRIRFIHAAPGVQMANLRLNRSPICWGVRYGAGTCYRSVIAGSPWVDVTTPSNGTNIVPGATGDFFPNLDYTILLTGSVGGFPELTTTTVELPSVKVPFNSAALVVVNALPDSPPIDLTLDGSLLPLGVPYAGYEPPMILPPGKHTFSVQEGANVLTPTTTRYLGGGQTHMMVVTGTLDPTDGYPVVLRFYSNY